MSKLAKSCSQFTPDDLDTKFISNEAMRLSQQAAPMFQKVPYWAQKGAIGING